MISDYKQDLRTLEELLELLLSEYTFDELVGKKIDSKSVKDQIKKSFTTDVNSSNPITGKSKNIYHKKFTNRMLATKTADVYDVINMFSVTNPMVQHALKKLLVTGGRSGGKSELQDLKEAAMSIEQAIKELET